MSKTIAEWFRQIEDNDPGVQALNFLVSEGAITNDQAMMALVVAYASHVGRLEQEKSRKQNRETMEKFKDIAEKHPFKAQPLDPTAPYQSTRPPIEIGGHDGR